MQVLIWVAPDISIVYPHEMFQLLKTFDLGLSAAQPYVPYGSGEFDGQGSGHDFYGTLYHPPTGYVNNCDGGRSHLACDVRALYFFSFSIQSLLRCRFLSLAFRSCVFIICGFLNVFLCVCELFNLLKIYLSLKIFNRKHDLTICEM
jgi:hypothetical protein